MGLTLKTIARLKEPGRYCHEHGLYLQVSRSGTKSWLFRFEIRGKEHMLGLGALHTTDFERAKKKAKQCREQLEDGVNPLAAKREARARAAGDAAAQKTFTACADAYLAKHRAAWSSARHVQQWEASLAEAGKVLGSMPVAAIGRADILRVLAPIWHDRTVTAGRMRGRIESVLSWATANGFRDGDNPAAWSTLKHDLADPTKIATVRNHAAIPFGELPSFYAELAQRPGTAAQALAFTILTAARTSEVTGALWSEMDLDAGIWEVPAERMKMDRPHRVPLAPAALDLLRALPREDGNPHVFMGPHKGRGLSGAAMAAVLDRCDRKETVHGFRASFKTWCSDETGFPPHLVEAALAHVNKDKVESAYNRGDLFRKRTKIMTAWASFVTSPAPAGNVVPMRKTKVPASA